MKFSLSDITFKNPLDAKELWIIIVEADGCKRKCDNTRYLA